MSHDPWVCSRCGHEYAFTPYRGGLRQLLHDCRSPNEEVPKVTKFYVEIRPKDGGPHRTLNTEVEEIIVPEVGQSFGLWDGMTVGIHSVYVYPTQDPMVYVRGCSISPETSAEADEIVDQAVRTEGWKVSGG